MSSVYSLDHSLFFVDFLRSIAPCTPCVLHLTFIFLLALGLIHTQHSRSHALTHLRTRLTSSRIDGRSGWFPMSHVSTGNIVVIHKQQHHIDPPQLGVTRAGDAPPPRGVGASAMDRVRPAVREQRLHRLSGVAGTAAAAGASPVSSTSAEGRGAGAGAGSVGAARGSGRADHHADAPLTTTASVSSLSLSTPSHKRDDTEGMMSPDEDLPPTPDGEEERHSAGPRDDIAPHDSLSLHASTLKYERRTRGGGGAVTSGRDSASARTSEDRALGTDGGEKRGHRNSKGQHSAGLSDLLAAEKRRVADLERRAAALLAIAQVRAHPTYHRPLLSPPQCTCHELITSHLFAFVVRTVFCRALFDFQF
jgi:hypothetical protein